MVHASLDERQPAPTQGRIPVEVLDQYDVHPAADLFPLIVDDQLRELAEDIRHNGQQEPIWMHEGQLLDGRNRAVACALAGVEPLTQEWEPRAGETPATFVMSRNVHRRHLSASQRATLAVRLAKVIAGERSERKKAEAETEETPQPLPEFMTRRPSVPPAPAHEEDTASAPLSSPFALPGAAERGEKVKQGRVREQAAASMGVSTGYVNDAANLEKAAPEMFNRVMRGEVSIPEAQKQVVAKHIEQGTLEDLKLRPGAIRQAMKALDEERAQTGKLPKATKVTTSRTTLQLTVTFGNGEVAEEWLSKLRADRRVLAMKCDEVPNPPARRKRSRS